MARRNLRRGPHTPWGSCDSDAECKNRELWIGYYPSQTWLLRLAAVTTCVMYVCYYDDGPSLQSLVPSPVPRQYFLGPDEMSKDCILCILESWSPDTHFRPGPHFIISLMVFFHKSLKCNGCCVACVLIIQYVFFPFPYLFQIFLLVSD